MDSYQAWPTPQDPVVHKRRIRDIHTQPTPTPKAKTDSFSSNLLGSTTKTTNIYYNNATRI